MRWKNDNSGRGANQTARLSWLVAIAIGWGVTGTMGGIGGCGLPNKIQARDLIRDANTLYNDGQYAKAIETYDRAEALEPDGFTLLWNRACAAEAQVLKLKSDDEAEERRKYADMALRDFQAWYDRLPEKTEDDAKQLQDHRLAILDADGRCDDLLSHWFAQHKADPKDDRLYVRIARQYEKCGQNDKADEWYIKRTADFPNSVQAWHALAVRRFDPLFPDPDSGLAFNEQLAPSARIEMADEVIRLLNKATELDPKFRDAYVWRSMAYTQRSLARVVVDKPEFVEEKLEALLMREDLVLAWKQQKAICDLEQLPECPGETPESPCCPPPPLSEEDQARDVDDKHKYEEEIKRQEERAAKKSGKRRKRRR
jgi:tetratricopeptide (TPR) repeat protein